MKIMKQNLFLVFIGLILFTASGCEKKEDNESPTSKWLGVYEGSSSHWESYPYGGGSDYNKTVVVNVKKGSQKSCLNLTITYNNSQTTTLENLMFSNTGSYSEETGGGSLSRSLSIYFKPNRLVYHYSSRGGMNYTSGVDFDIYKK